MTVSFERALRALNDMKADSVVSEYAVAGAMAILFWSEPIPTYDLDVLVHGFRSEKEHIIIEDLPVQFVPAHNALADEAIETAAEVTYAGTSVRVVRPEYLIALYLEGSAATAKLARAAALRESGKIDEALLRDLAQRFKIPL